MGCSFTPKGSVLGNLIKCYLPIPVSLLENSDKCDSVTAKPLLGLVAPTLARETPPRLLSHKQQCGVTYETKPNTATNHSDQEIWGSEEESSFKTVLWERMSTHL